MKIFSAVVLCACLTAMAAGLAHAQGKPTNRKLGRALKTIHRREL